MPLRDSERWEQHPRSINYSPPSRLEQNLCSSSFWHRQGTKRPNQGSQYPARHETNLAGRDHDTPDMRCQSSESLTSYQPSPRPEEPISFFYGHCGPGRLPKTCAAALPFAARPFDRIPHGSALYRKCTSGASDSPLARLRPSPLPATFVYLHQPMRPA